MKIEVYIFILVIIFSRTATAQQAKSGGATTNKGSKYEASLSDANSFYLKKDWKNAVASYNAVLADTSTSALLWQRLAYSNLMSNQLDISLKHYNKSLSLNPNPGLRGVIYSNIFQIFQKLKKSKEAFAFLKSEAENGFNNTYLIDTLHLLDPFRSSDDFKKLASRVQMNSFPCLSQPHRSDFDFWVGEWDVYKTGATDVVGHSVITKDPGGCSVMEDWTSLISPQTGKSINYYDAAKDYWEQVYVGSGGGNTLYSNGVYKDGQMHFTYSSVYNGSPYTGNFIFYNQGPDQVRQYQDYTIDGGKTFVATTDLTYKRKKK